MDELFDMFLLMETLNSPELAVDPLFVHDKFFSTHDVTPAEEAKFTVTYGTNRLASFTPELAKAKPVGKKTGEVKSFSFPNIRMDKPFTTAELFKNDALGKIVDPTVNDVNALVERKTGRELQDLKNMILLRIEWMCCQLITGGAWTYTDEEHKVVFDMQIGTDYNVTLGASDQWTETTADIDANVRLARRRIQRATGVGLSDVVLGEDAAAAFRNNQRVRDTLHNNNLQSGQVKNDANDNYIGRYMNVDWWEYSREYEDENGDVQNFFPPNGASFIASNFKAGVLFGGVKELTPDKKSLTMYLEEIFVKTFTEEDPPSMNILVHSRPCPWYHNGGAVVFMEVVD